MRRRIFCFLLAVIMGLTVFALSSCSDSAADISVNETDKDSAGRESDIQNTITQKFSAEKKYAPSSSPSGAKETSSTTASLTNNQKDSDSAGTDFADNGSEYINETVDNTESQGQSGYRQGSSSSATDSESAIIAGTTNTCAFVIDCLNALKSDKLSDNLRKVLPDDGIIYSASSVEFSDGETVFDILYRITRDNGIPMEFSSSPLYGSKYIEGINSLFEFDCGELSGWEYKVNGVFPNYGCDLYTVHSGDNIGFYYTTNLGEDLK